MSLARLATKASPESTAPILLRQDQMREQVERLWSLSLRERKGLSSLNPEKADVILAGAVIYEAILSQFNFAELLVCSCSLGSGALMARPAETARFTYVAPKRFIPSLPGMRHEPKAIQTAAHQHR